MKWLYASAANLLALPLLPWLLAQGKRTRRNTPRLPEAAGARQGLAGNVQHHAQQLGCLRLLVIGESPVAGVGVTHQEEAITARFAQALANRHHCQVAWQALGKNGATVGNAVQELLPQVPTQAQDIVLVAFGVNDTSAFHSTTRFARDLQQLLDALLQRCTPRLLLLSGLPPIGHLPALPQPLRAVLGLKAAALHAVTLELSRKLAQSDRRTRILHVPLSLPVTDPELLASDGYHPSAKACQLWGELLARQIAPHL